jgi:putative lipoic acid-binding regulatory protein
MVKKHRLNGNNKKPDVSGLPKEEINFPVSYELKAIFIEPSAQEMHKANLAKTFDALQVEYKLEDQKLSKKGNYISFTYAVHLDNHEQMTKLYEALKKIDGLKFAL